MRTKPPLAVDQHDVPRERRSRVFPPNVEDVARPHRRHHAGSGDSEAQLTSQAKHFLRQLAFQRLANLYALSVYSRLEMPANSREMLERFWETLNRVTEQPLSA